VNVDFLEFKGKKQDSSVKVSIDDYEEDKSDDFQVLGKVKNKLTEPQIFT
jgi:hypothetical protein